MSTMTTANTDLQVGFKVSPVVRWGNQRRLQCPACRRYMKAESSQILGEYSLLATSACGAEFAQVGDTDDFVVVRLP